MRILTEIRLHAPLHESESIENLTESAFETSLQNYYLYKKKLLCNYA